MVHHLKSVINKMANELLYSATNILRSVSANHNRRLSNTILHVLSAIIANTNEPITDRTKACHILSTPFDSSPGFSILIHLKAYWSLTIMSAVSMRGLPER